MIVKVRINNIKKKIIDIFLYLYALLLILNCHSIYNNRVGYNLHISEIICFIAIILLFITVVFNYDNNRLYKGMIISICTMCFSLLFLIAHLGEGQEIAIIVRYIIFLPCVIIFFSIDRNNSMNFMVKISNVVVVIAVISLFFWMFGSVLQVIKPTGKVLVGWGGEYYKNSYFDIYYETQHLNFLNFNNWRNSGIFTEGRFMRWF